MSDPVGTWLNTLPLQAAFAQIFHHLGAPFPSKESSCGRGRSTFVQGIHSAYRFDPANGAGEILYAAKLNNPKLDTVALGIFHRGARSRGRSASLLVPAPAFSSGGSFTSVKIRADGDHLLRKWFVCDFHRNLEGALSFKVKHLLVLDNDLAIA